MDRSVYDLRMALRGLLRAPTFTITAVLILGLGIGMSAAMWTVFDAVLLRRLPVTDQNRIVLPRVLDQAGVDAALSVSEVDQLQGMSRTMRSLSAVAHAGAYAAPLMDGDRQVHMAGSQVYGNLFEVLGVRPVLGRLLRAEDDSTSHVMVLSYGAWQRQFGGDPSVLGHQLRQTWLPVPYTIVGVAPPGLDYPVGSEYWVPLPFPQSMNVVARLAPGTLPEAARAEFLSIMQRLDRQQRSPANVRSADIRTLTAAVLGNVRPALAVVAAAVGLLLLIACVNVGNLLLLRSATRSREFAIRRALGATHGALVRQLIAESVLLGAAGGIFGLLFAGAALRALIAAAPRQLPRLDEVGLAGAPIAASAAIVLFCVFVFGLLPAVTAVDRNPASPLRVDTRSGSATRRRRIVRQLLVASQVALALVMLAGAGLLARSLQRLTTIDLGLRADHLSIIDLSIPRNKLGSPPEEEKLFGVLDAVAPPLAAVRGVTALTPIIMPPLMGPNFWTGVWQADWQSAAQAQTNPMTAYEGGGPDYFRTFGIPIVRGRGFLDSDRKGAPNVVVVSEAVAQHYWPNQDPIGKRIRMSYDREPWRTVVGVSGESRFRALREATPMIYMPQRQSYWQGMIAVRTTADINTLLPVIRRTISEADPGVMVWTARAMDEYLGVQLAQPRLSALLLSAFGLVALVLAAIGLYGVMASAVRQQTREIGVRMALGATAARVRREVLGAALGITAVGAVVGIFVALVSSKFLSALLFEISPTDPIVLCGACALLLVIGVGAAYVPARWATKVDPAQALRAET